MEISDIRLNGLVNELLELLEQDAENISLTLRRLNRLRAAVIKRDQDDIKVLLGTVRNEEDVNEKIELRRFEVRSRLAEYLGWDLEQVNLTNLRKKVTQETADILKVKQEELRELTRKLRIEHECTSSLLKECSRFNKMLLRAILNNGDETVTYNSRGGTTWETQNRLVSFRL